MGDAVALASRLRPVWPCIHEMSLWLARRLPGGSDATTGMNKGGTFAFGEISVTMVGADHSAGDWNPGGETTLYLGEPAGFVVRLENGGTIYHAGDTNVFGDMRLIGELYRPDLALLPIGGHFTMGPREAALAVELLGVDAVAPIHWGTFPILAGTPAALRARAGRARAAGRHGPRLGAGGDDRRLTWRSRTDGDVHRDGTCCTPIGARRSCAATGIRDVVGFYVDRSRVSTSFASCT